MDGQILWSPSFSGPFEAFEAFWWLLAPLGGFLGVRFPARALVWGPLAEGPFPEPWLGGTLAGCLGRASSGTLGRAWPGGPWRGALDPTNPCAGLLGLNALDRGAPGLWPGRGLGHKTLGRPGRPLARGPLAWAPCPGGPLGRGALGPARPWPGGPLARLGPEEGKPRKSPQNHEIAQPACLDPSPASWSRNPATGDQGAPGGGGPANPEPKTLNRPPEAGLRFGVIL